MYWGLNWLLNRLLLVQFYYFSTVCFCWPPQKKKPKLWLQWEKLFFYDVLFFSACEAAIGKPHTHFTAFGRRYNFPPLSPPKNLPHSHRPLTIVKVKCHQKCLKNLCKVLLTRQLISGHAAGFTHILTFSKVEKKVLFVLFSSPFSSSAFLWESYRSAW